MKPTRNKMRQYSWDAYLFPEGIAEYKCVVRAFGGGRSSMVVQVPKDLALALDIQPGDRVEVAIRKVVD